MHDETAEDQAVGATRANLLVRAEAIGLVGPALSRLERLCSSPAGMDDALRLIRDEEMAHQRRANVIRRSVEVLVAAGFDATSTLGLPQDAALDTLDRMEAMHERIRALEQRIALGLSGVNESARDRLLARLERIRSLDHVSELDNLDSEVAAARVATRTRRDGLLDRGRVLEGLGFRFDRQRLAALTEISALAARVETFETEVERRTEARDEIAEHAWDEDLMAAWTNLETDAWWTLHEAHRTAWRASEMEAHARLEPWSAAGLDLERWVSGIEDDPDAVIEWEREQAAELAHTVGLIERLDALDVSVTGAEEVDAVVERLRMAPVDQEAQAHAQRTIEGFERRAARHLRMLMTSWHDLVARNLASRDAPIHTWTLARFEDELSNRLRIRTEVKSRASTDPMSLDLERWTSAGFDTAPLEQALREDPMGIALEWSSIRREVEDHAQLVLRLTPLPLGRSEVDLQRVQQDLKRPNRLAELRASIPDLIRTLAGMQGSDGEWTPWRPHEARPSPSEVPSPEPVAVLEPEIVMDEADHESEPVMDDNDVEPQEDELSAGPDGNGSEPPLQDVHPDVSELAGVLFGPTGGEGEGAVRRRIARSVGQVPRDQRLDRLLRIAVRLLGASTEPDVRGRAVEELSMAAKALERWTIRRCEARQVVTGNGLIEDAARLGKALHRIPGPGERIRLTADGMELPSSLEPQALLEEARKVRGWADRPMAGGVRAT